ncbi:MAG: M20/M25/M40 family metallo-hydrolase, partial [Bdellovibrionales bacterium]|nr:M20/M25/M40 family metallo-hydrolase [Bdellovibrionales bacterium]
MMQARKVALSLLPLLLLFSTAIGSPGQEFWITIGKETLDSSMKQIGLAHFNVEKAVGDAALVKINEEALPALSKLMHHEFKRCGGYFRHNSYEDALETLALNRSVPHTINKEFVDYSINSQLLVKSIIQNVRAVSIEGMIRQLANFKNRYYKSKHGINAANWVADFWRNLAKERSDTKVELFEHSQSPQPSVILTIKGRSDELIIIGGHLDSIAGWWNRSNAKSPGADDNASGIATMTEVIRVLLQRDFVPEKTIKFIAYAAEEVGLIGSQDIARFYSDNSEVVAGVLQLDMTNYKGSDSLDIVL